MHDTATNEMRRLVNDYCPHPTTVLDVGSYDVNGNYRGFFGDETTYVGCDLREGPNVDIVVDDHGPLPKTKGGWDLVISGSTLEHCLNPFRLVQRIADAMDPGGYFIVAAPFMWHYHEHPIDCFRFAPEGLRSVCEEAGLEVLYAAMSEYRQDHWDTFAVARKGGGE